MPSIVDNMRPTQKYHPEYNFRSLLVKFAHGEPLSCDELNYLNWHEKHLSGPLIDPISKYYLKLYRQKTASHHTFLLPHEIINKDAISKLKKRLHILIKQKSEKIEFTLTNIQFMQLKTISYGELILYHGNHFLTGAPYHPGGIPHIVYFQWGNLFGVAKYVVMAEEKALKSNILIYVEDMEERYLEQCIKDYDHEHRDELTVDIQHQNTMELRPAIQAPLKQENVYSPFSIPSLTLNKNKSGKKEE